jgi:hypothetical protein
MKTSELQKTEADNCDAQSGLSPVSCSARLWYYARVKNSAGMHTVFYGKTRPKVGSTCEGIASPNRITGWWRRPAPQAPNVPAEPSGTRDTKQSGA